MTGCKELAESNGDQEWCVCSGPEKVRRRSELTGLCWVWVSLGTPVSQGESFTGISHRGTH